MPLCVADDASLEECSSSQRPMVEDMRGGGHASSVVSTELAADLSCLRDRGNCNVEFFTSCTRRFCDTMRFECLWRNLRTIQQTGAGKRGCNPALVRDVLVAEDPWVGVGLPAHRKLASSIP